LAAESEGFKAGNPHAGVSKQPSKSTTSNNTDTSAAKVLAPAVDAEARKAEEEWNENKILNAGREKPTTSTSKPTTTSKGRDGSGTLSGSHSSGGGAKAVGLKSNEEKDEGGFDGPNASMGDVDIGGKDDPGRLAEEKIERHNAQFDGGHGARDMGIEAETGRYDALKDDAQ
jgi:hypothetical protein